MPRIKVKKIYKDQFVGFRCTELERNEIQLRANLYTEGNISEYILYSALNYNVNESDLDTSDMKKPPSEGA